MNDAFNTLINYISKGINRLSGDLLMPLAAGIVIIMIIWSGIKYFIGDAEGGKKSLLAAIIGLIIVLISFTIIRTLVDFISTV